MSPFDPHREASSYPSYCASPPTCLTVADLLPPAAYERVRPRARALIIALKRKRRVRIAPHVVLLFECRDTVWLQVQEVLRAEGSTPRRAREELERYACLVPPPGELRATAMIDGGSPDEGRRLARALRRPGALRLGCGARACDSALARADDRDAEDAVQYLRFSDALGLGLERSGASLELRASWSRTSLVAPGELRSELARDLGGPQSPR